MTHFHVSIGVLMYKLLASVSISKHPLRAEPNRGGRTKKALEVSEKVNPIVKPMPMQFLNVK
jgi:hypothetical protein